MKRKIKIFNLINCLLAVSMLTAIFAAYKQKPLTNVEEAPLHIIGYKKVDRTKVLEKFLQKYQSPLAENAQTFVTVADKYNIDYKVLPAISCVESTCGKFLIQETHNPFGWGGGLITFDSYDAAIEGVGKGLDEIYLSKGLDTPAKIAPVYTPPSYQSWLRNLSFFMQQMDEIALEI